MHAEGPAWQRWVALIGVAVWLLFVPGAWLAYVLVAGEGDWYGAVFTVLVLLSGAACLGVGAPLAVLCALNRRRWRAGLLAVALVPLLRLLGFVVYLSILTLNRLMNA